METIWFLIMPGICFIIGLILILLINRYQLKKFLDYWGGDNKIKENPQLYFNANYAIVALSLFCVVYLISSLVYQNSVNKQQQDMDNKKIEKQIHDKAEELIFELKKQSINEIKKDMGKQIDHFFNEKE